MKSLILRALSVPALSLAAALQAPAEGFVFEPKPGAPGNGKHVVFVTGDDEYFSEEGMPRVAHILAARHGFRCTVLFAINKQTGTIDPGAQDNIPGLEALKDADLMVIFTRFRSLPDEQFKPIADYLESGRPIIGLRTATHAFRYDGNSPSPYKKWSWDNPDPDFAGGFGKQILGETWVNHHGGHGRQSTRGMLVKEQAKHPVLRGIGDGEIWGETDVYGIRLPLPADSTPLVLGAVLDSMKPDGKPVAGKQNDPMMPVAWTREMKLPDGKVRRVFTTTMGGAMAGGSDLNNEALRRLLVNATYWATGLEAKIPAKADAADVLDKNPFKRGVKPSDVSLGDKP